jgi:hypothetical protein
MSDIIDIETRRKKRKPLPDTEKLSAALRRAIARGSPMRCLSAKHEAAILIWRATAIADADPNNAADFLEMAAQRLRKGGGNAPPPAGHSRQKRRGERLACRSPRLTSQQAIPRRDMS